MAKHAQKLQVKSVELTAEKRRADTLLCQMLPKEVAEQLKMNKEVKADQSKVKVKQGQGRGLRGQGRTVKGHGQTLQKSKVKVEY